MKDTVGENLLRKQIRRKRTPNLDNAETQEIQPGLRPSGVPDCLAEVVAEIEACPTVVFRHELQYKAEFRQLVQKIRQGQQQWTLQLPLFSSVCRRDE